MVLTQMIQDTIAMQELEVVRDMHMLLSQMMEMLHIQSQVKHMRVKH